MPPPATPSGSKRTGKRVRATAAGETAERLLEAAMTAFMTDGFAGTDTNRIARAAGFAPQTFYRWYPDKVAIFIACYHRWEQEERLMLDRARARGADARQLARVIVRHHRHYRHFRRSLRQLAVAHATVRAARAASRQRQAEYLLSQHPHAGIGRDAVLVILFQIERLADAHADDEGTDLALAPRVLLDAIAELVARLAGGAPERPPPAQLVAGQTP